MTTETRLNEASVALLVWYSDGRSPFSDCDTAFPEGFYPNSVNGLGKFHSLILAVPDGNFIWPI